MGTLRSADSGLLCWFVLVLFYLFYITLLTKTRENNTPPKKKPTKKQPEKINCTGSTCIVCLHFESLCVPVRHSSHVQQTQRRRLESNCPS